jgi:hypothetical protein
VKLPGTAARMHSGWQFPTGISILWIIFQGSLLERFALKPFILKWLAENSRFASSFDKKRKQ